MPFVTGWMGENHFDGTPTAVYGTVLLLAGIAYVILERTIIAADGPTSKLARAVGRDAKGIVSTVLYAAAVPLAFASHWIAQAIYVFVAAMWLYPDRRIESTLAD